jgi:hypothetical protein
MKHEGTKTQRGRLLVGFAGGDEPRRHEDTKGKVGSVELSVLVSLCLELKSTRKHKESLRSIV